MATAVTSGIWASMTSSPPGLRGLGSDHVRWGAPIGGSDQSGYRFGGTTVQVPLDGAEFILGTFTHENFPVSEFSPSEFDVDLRVRVEFDGGVPARDFSFRFHHNETPNEGPSPDDEVSLPALQSPETVHIDGEEYLLMISGFKQGGQIVTKFMSAENDANSADIVAKLIAHRLLPAPSGLAANPEDRQVVLSWGAVAGAASYNLYWSTSEDVSKQNGTSIADVSSPFTHTGLTNGTIYYYVVTAVDHRGESAESERVSVAPVAPNVAPIASFAVAPEGGQAPLQVTFDASASTDPDGTIRSYAWDFGDRQRGTGVIAFQRLSGPGRLHHDAHGNR